jgi:hypothetical protein
MQKVSNFDPRTLTLRKSRASGRQPVGPSRPFPTTLASRGPVSATRLRVPARRSGPESATHDDITFHHRQLIDNALHREAKLYK